MIPAFWDASAVVPLCVQQGSTADALGLAQRYDLAVWWGTHVEARSAFERLFRMGQITMLQGVNAGLRLEQLRRRWSELQPADALRTQAEMFLTQYPLKAADALQLAAAWVWCSGDARTLVFISGDQQLLEGARQVGFQVIAV